MHTACCNLCFSVRSPLPMHAGTSSHTTTMHHLCPNCFSWVCLFHFPYMPRTLVRSSPCNAFAQIASHTNTSSPLPLPPFPSSATAPLLIGTPLLLFLFLLLLPHLLFLLSYSFLLFLHYPFLFFFFFLLSKTPVCISVSTHGTLVLTGMYQFDQITEMSLILKTAILGTKDSEVYSIQEVKSITSFLIYLLAPKTSSFKYEIYAKEPSSNVLTQAYLTRYVK